MTGSPPPRWSRADLARHAAPLVVIAALAVAWSMTPLGELLPRLREWMAALREVPLAPVLVVAVYAAGGLLVVPVSVLMPATVVAFGPLLGTAYALLGALASAAVRFGIGRGIGRESLDPLLGDRARRVAGRISVHGVVLVAVARNLPVAPYSVVNLVAGASPLGFLDDLVGTAIGFVPRLAAMAVLGETLAALAAMALGLARLAVTFGRLPARSG